MDSRLSTDGGNSLLPCSSSWNKMKGMDKNGISPSFDARWEQQLHKIPRRLYLTGASKVASSLFSQQGKKGVVNQDAIIVWESFGSRTDTVFCGVFDGHGPLGHFVAKRVSHFVAKRVRDSLPLKLSTHWQVTEATDNSRDNLSRSVSVTSEETESYVHGRGTAVISRAGGKGEASRDLLHSFLKPFKAMDNELRFHPNVDFLCSGTTTLLWSSRDKILSTRDEENNLSPVQLTVDLKPNTPSVEKHRESDDVLNNKEVVDIIASAPSHSLVARYLAESAVRIWKFKYKTSKVDDCGVVCLFVKANSKIKDDAKPGELDEDLEITETSEN